MTNKYQEVAYRKSIIGGVVIAPILFVVWLIAAMIIYFHTGGGIVGGNDNPTLARIPAMLLITGMAAFLNFWIVVNIYRGNMTKQKPNLSNVSIPKKVYITGILIPLTVILIYLIYRWFA